MAIPQPRPGAAALITGASSGIGAEFARQLCARGHDAVLVARRKEKLDELAAELRERHGRRVEVLVCDVADADDRARIPAEVDGLGLEVDVLILSAGFGMGGPFIKQDPARIQQMTRTNLESTMAISRALLPAMVERRSGALLVVSSYAGGQPMPHFGAYAATKAGATSFAEMLSCELEPYSITVTALCPGGVWTEFAEVAGMEHNAEEVPKALMMKADECARQAIEGLDAGKRIVMPKAAVRAFSFFGKHAPRRIWLRLCQRMMREA
jgi:uncharacterized protein